MAELLVLRLVHVLGGIFWVGGLMYMAFFLIPVMAQAGPAAGPVMAGLQARKLFIWLPVTAIATLLAGIRLLMIRSDGFGAGYFGTPMGRTYLVAGSLSVIAFALGITISRPAMARIGVLSAAMPSADESSRGQMQAEIAALRKRSGFVTMVVTWLLVAAAAGMAVARYM